MPSVTMARAGGESAHDLHAAVGTLQEGGDAIEEEVHALLVGDAAKEEEERHVRLDASLTEAAPLQCGLGRGVRA